MTGQCTTTKNGRSLQTASFFSDLLIKAFDVVKRDDIFRIIQIDVIFPSQVIAGSYDLLRNAADLALAGLGFPVALCSLYTNPGLKCVPLEPAMTLELYLVWKKGRVASEAARLFLNLCLTERQRDGAKKEAEVIRYPKGRHWKQ